MAQIRNRLEIKNAIDEDRATNQTNLPNLFQEEDELKPIMGLTLSVATHVLFAVLFIMGAIIQSIVMVNCPKPELPRNDIEFRLVQNESKPPINKNTKIISDRDSRAGGIHDPKKMISEPSPSPSKAQAKASGPAQKKVKPQPIQEPSKQIAQQPKPQPKVQPKPQPIAPSKPSVAKAPTAPKPAVKPTLKPQGAAAPTAPKIATAPKSPFNVAVPSSKAPVGSTYRPQGTPASGAGGGSSKGTSGSGAPSAPKFSSSGGTGGAGSGSSGGKYASRGSGGYGSQGNPSPGNPNGAPGIDAIRQPNWGPYMRDLEQRIKKNWSPPKGDSSKRVVITFTIGRDGRLLSHQITKSSGVPLADRAAMSAIELTAPFRPLPPEFKGSSVPIEFTFDYNVLNSVLR